MKKRSLSRSTIRASHNVNHTLATAHTHTHTHTYIDESIIAEEIKESSVIDRAEEIEMEHQLV